MHDRTVPTRAGGAGAARAGTRRGGASARPGFSVVEASVALAIIALLASILFVAIRKVRSSGSDLAERGAVVALKTGVEHFRSTYGFLPPLVIDANVQPTTPSNSGNTGVPPLWTQTDLADNNSSVNNGDKFSVYSLPFYLVGSLPKRFDGVDGPGFTTPQKDGSFSLRGAYQESIFQAERFKTKAGQARLQPNPDPTLSPPLVANDLRMVLLDYYSDLSTKTPIRYYRWYPTYYPQSDQANKGKVRYWNIPFAAGGEFNQSNPPADTGLRDATYAIVSAGPDHAFGDERLADLQRIMGDTTTPAQALREKARKDNLVEYGR
jgi:type II secretory pathway pseudopilin PulG